MAQRQHTHLFGLGMALFLTACAFGEPPATSGQPWVDPNEPVDTPSHDADAPALDPNTFWTDVTPIQWPRDCDSTLLSATGQLTTDGTGMADLALPGFADLRTLHVVARADGSSPLLVEIDDPDGGMALNGEDWWGDEVLTHSIFASEGREVRGLQWPIRSVDSRQGGMLGAGDWTFRLGASADGASLVAEEPVDWTAYAILDPNPRLGCLQLEVGLAKGLEDVPGLLDAVEEALAHTASIYEQAGLTVSWQINPEVEIAADYDGKGSEAVAAWSAQVPAYVVPVVIVDNLGGATHTLGRAVYGAPLGPSEVSAVTVGFAPHAGTDRTFAAHEIELFGHTMAHELGHYLGLPHPVDVDSTGAAVRFDALDDTPRCDDLQACTGELGSNLMFPTSWCFSNPDECERPDVLTPQQVDVLRRWAGAL